MTGLAVFTSLQQRVADDLLGLGAERPVADLSWGPELAAWIEDSLVDRAPRERLRVSKGAIAGAHGCETYFLQSKSDFAWTTEIAKGVVVHHAIALAAAGSDAPARDLACAAVDLAKTTGGRSLGAWLSKTTEQGRVDLVAQAVVGIDGFLSAFPRLLAAWHPVAEFPVGATIGNGQIRVTGRVDLALGTNRPGPDGRLRRRRMFIEVKTGRPRAEHRAEHLFYALLETIRTGVAPFRAATFYTADSNWVADDITIELLVIAARRLVDATRKLVELGDGRAPTRLPGWRCGFCPLSETCPERAQAEEAEGRHRDYR